MAFFSYGLFNDPSPYLPPDERDSYRPPRLADAHARPKRVLANPHERPRAAVIPIYIPCIRQSRKMPNLPFARQTKRAVRKLFGK